MIEASRSAHRLLRVTPEVASGGSSVVQQLTGWHTAHPTGAS
jgi:hypothetical protein